MYYKERFETYLDVDEMLNKYYNYDETYRKCSQCPGFGETWACPDFDFDPKDYWLQFSRFHFIVDRISNEGASTVEEAQNRLFAEKKIHDEEMLAMEEVCPGILLKVPDDKVNDGGYNVQTAHPAAFAMYIPTQDRKPPDVAAPIPSLCVQLLKGKHAPAQHIGQMTIQLALATWNPGQHGSEMAVPEQDPQALGGVKYRREPSENFKRNLEGWRDVWSFTDKVLQAIENTEYIAGLRLVKENNIEYGPFTEDGALVSYYPYWFCWVQFTLEHGLARKIPADYEKLL